MRNYIDVSESIIRVSNTVIDAEFAKKHTGKTLIIFDEDMYSYDEVGLKKYPSSSIFIYVESCREYYHRNNKAQDLPPDDECIYVPAICDWCYSPTATAYITDNKTYHMSRGDSDYIILKNSYVNTYGGHSRGGFVKIKLP